MEHADSVLIFLSYAGEHHAVAEDVAVALSMDGHEVFLDQKSLRPGEASDAPIRDAIARCSLVVLLVAPILFTKDQSYVLSELREVERRWRDPTNRVLPVILAPTDRRTMPPYIKRLQFLQPEGDVAAEVAAEVAALVRRRDSDQKREPLSPLLAEARLAAYRSLWKLTGVLPKWGRGHGRGYEDLKDLSEGLRHWYFDESGGLFLSKGAYAHYANLQEALRLIGAGESSGDLSDADYEYVRARCSSLRRFIAAEIGTRR